MIIHTSELFTDHEPLEVQEAVFGREFTDCLGKAAGEAAFACLIRLRFLGKELIDHFLLDIVQVLHIADLKPDLLGRELVQ